MILQTIVRETFAMDKRLLDANIERIRKAAGRDAKISVEQNDKNGGVAIRIQLYKKPG